MHRLSRRGGNRNNRSRHNPFTACNIASHAEAGIETRIHHLDSATTDYRLSRRGGNGNLAAFSDASASAYRLSRRGGNRNKVLIGWIVTAPEESPLTQRREWKLDHIATNHVLFQSPLSQR